jgi:hypothetical protein
VFIASALNAKVHLLSGIVVGVGTLLLVKQMCNRKKQKQHHRSVISQPAPVGESASE